MCFHNSKCFTDRNKCPITKESVCMKQNLLTFLGLGFYEKSSLFLLCCSTLLGHTALGPWLPYNQQWLVWDKHGHQNPVLAQKMMAGSCRGRNVFFQAFSERLLSFLSGTSPFPFTVGKAMAHWALAALHFSLRLFCWCLLMISKYF